VKTAAPDALDQQISEAEETISEMRAS